MKPHTGFILPYNKDNKRMKNKMEKRVQERLKTRFKQQQYKYSTYC